MHNKCSKTWREALTRGPGQHDDDLEGLAGAAVGQVDDERGEPPVAARSDAHGDVRAVHDDEVRQVASQAERGPPPEPELAPAVAHGSSGYCPSSSARTNRISRPGSG